MYIYITDAIKIFPASTLDFMLLKMYIPSMLPLEVEKILVKIYIDGVCYYQSIFLDDNIVKSSQKYEGQTLIKQKIQI